MAGASADRAGHAVARLSGSKARSNDRTRQGRAGEGAGRSWVRFSNGREGVRDLSDGLAEGGPMAEPLRAAALFRRGLAAWVVPAWPQGPDLDTPAPRRAVDDTRPP